MTQLQTTTPTSPALDPYDDTDILGRFHMKSAFARGSMAEIWLADETGSASDVVLKTVRNDLAHDVDTCTSFQREMNITAMLNHDHIVRHVAHGSWRGVDVLALEHIRGKNLAQLLTRSLLPTGPALRIAADIGRALAYVHSMNDDAGAPLSLVHGDVSPENIVIDMQGRARLIDFGNLTMRGMKPSAAWAGKPGYSSPEQTRGEPGDARSDQYALGVILWQMLAGRALFTNSPTRSTFVVPPVSLFTTVSDTLEAALVRMLACDPEARFATMDEACDMLCAGCEDASADSITDDREWLARLAGCARADRQPRHEQIHATIPMRAHS